MFTDIIFPKNNEKRFIEIAEKLEIKSMCLVYNAESKNNTIKIMNLQKTTKIKLFAGIIAEAKNIKKLRKLTQITLIQASDRNRDIIEKAKPDVIFNMENSLRRDFIYSRNSGLNQVLCKLANKNDVMIGVSFNNIINNKNKNVLLGRIKQNIKLCQKYKVRIVIASFAENPYEMRNPYELRSLLAALGTNTTNQKGAIQNTYLKIQNNLKKKES